MKILPKTDYFPSPQWLKYWMIFHTQGPHSGPLALVCKVTIQFLFDVTAPTVVKPELAVVGVQKAGFVCFAVDPADDTELSSFRFGGMVAKVMRYTKKQRQTKPTQSPHPSRPHPSHPSRHPPQALHHLTLYSLTSYLKLPAP